MTRWDLKTSYRKLLLLISCLAMALPGVAGSGLCQDDCGHCSSTRSDNGTAKMKSPCCCCTVPVQEDPSCCQSEESSAVQQACTCLDMPAAPQASSALEKTEELVSSLTQCQQLSPFVVFTASGDSSWHTAKISRSNNPGLLRSVILLI